MTDRLIYLKSSLLGDNNLTAPRIGVDFFPMLCNDIETLIEGTDYQDVWGAE